MYSAQCALYIRLAKFIPNAPSTLTLVELPEVTTVAKVIFQLAEVC
jgi:hypothetical protein